MTREVKSGILNVDDIVDTNPFRYCGEYYDTVSGTIYLRARYYNSDLGRFTQQDGWEFANPEDPLSLNLYTYCYNSPVLYVDPTGHFINTIICGVTGAIVGGVRGLFRGKDAGKLAAIGAITGAISGLGLDIFAVLTVSSAGVGIGAGALAGALSGFVVSFVGCILEQTWVNGAQITSELMWDAFQAALVGSAFGAISGSISVFLGQFWSHVLEGNLFQKLIQLLRDSKVDEVIVNALFNFAYVILPQVTTETIITEFDNDEINDDLNVKTEMNNTENFEQEEFFGKGVVERNLEFPYDRAVCRRVFG